MAKNMLHVVDNSLLLGYDMSVALKNKVVRFFSMVENRVERILRRLKMF